MDNHCRIFPILKRSLFNSMERCEGEEAAISLKKMSVDRVTILVLCHHTTTAVTVILYYQIQGKLWKTYCQLKGWMHEHFNCKKLFLNLNSSNFAYYTLFKIRLGALLTRSVCRLVGPSVCPTKITKLYKTSLNITKHQKIMK